MGNGELYVGVNNGAIKVFDVATGKEKRTFITDIPEPRMAVDKLGLLWIGSKTGDLLQCRADGTPTGKKLAGLATGALHVDARGRLFVAESGARQQVIVYDISAAPPKELFVVGELGGIFTGPRPGAIVPERLWDPRAVGTDAAGNIYIGVNRATRAYSPDGKTMLWQAYCTEFITSAAVDPASDGADIYTPGQHFRHGPAQIGGSEWHWVGTSMAPSLEQGWKVNNGYVRRLNGQLYHFTVEGNGHILARRQPPNQEFMVPATFIMHAYGGWKEAPGDLPKDKWNFVWVDRNGNETPEADEVIHAPDGTRKAQYVYGTFVDDRGGLWFPEGHFGVRYLPLLEILPTGALVYDYAQEQWFSRPAEMIQVLRNYYDVESDIMYLMGTTWEDPVENGMPHMPVAGAAGRAMFRVDQWSKPERSVTWRARLPESVNILAFDVAPKAKLAFAADVQTSGAFCLDTDTGKLLGFLEPAREKIGDTGWLDVRSAIHSFTRANGETIVLSENCYSQHVIVYRIPPREQWPKEE